MNNFFCRNQLQELSDELQQIESKVKRKTMQKQILLQELQNAKQNNYNSMEREAQTQFHQTKYQSETTTNGEVLYCFSFLNCLFIPFK